jgi:hypothetical protein
MSIFKYHNSCLIAWWWQASQREYGEPTRRRIHRGQAARSHLTTLHNLFCVDIVHVLARLYVSEKTPPRAPTPPSGELSTGIN